jgi:hypothetical protein
MFTIFLATASPAIAIYCGMKSFADFRGRRTAMGTWGTVCSVVSLSPIAMLLPFIGNGVWP